MCRCILYYYVGVFPLTVCVCMGRRSRTPLPRVEQPEAGWSRTMRGCVSRCGTPCVCTVPTRLDHPHTACSLGSPPHCPHHNSPLGSSSARGVGRRRTGESGPAFQWNWLQRAHTHTHTRLHPHLKAECILIIMMTKVVI